MWVNACWINECVNPTWKAYILNSDRATEMSRTDREWGERLNGAKHLGYVNCSILLFQQDSYKSQIHIQYTPNYNVDIWKLLVLFITIFIFVLVKEAFQITFNDFWLLFALFSYLFNLTNYHTCTIIMSHHSINHYNSFLKC